MAFERARDAVSARATAVGAAAGTRRPYAATLTPLRMATAPPIQRQLLLVVLGTAVCLLLTACANVASLELTAAVARARSSAIRLALGETRSRLIGGALAEGLVLVMIAATTATMLARIGTTALATYLPDQLHASSGNTLDVDMRALAFMAAAALLTWAAASLPVVLFAARANVADLLRLGGTGATPPGSRLRRAITVAEVAVAVVLLAGTLLYTRTYGELAAVDNGWNPHNLAVIDVSLPGRLYPTLPAKREFAGRAIERLTAAHAIIGGIWGSPPPDAAARLADAARLVRSMEPRGEVHVSMVEDEYTDAFADRRFAAELIGGFGLLAFLLAGTGIYGVMAFIVASRGREIGIRMAFGADAAAIRRLVLGAALSMVGIGIALGAAIGIAAGRLLQSQLFGVRAFDPVTWLIVLGAVAAIAGLATWRPAHAATRVDPSVLLRE